jgi:hypothetical protein
MACYRDNIFFFLPPLPMKENWEGWKQEGITVGLGSKGKWEKADKGTKSV